MAFNKDKYLNLLDFETAGRQFLPPCLYSYVASAVEDEVNLLTNRDGFAKIELLPRVLRNVSQISTEFELFGRSYSAPIGVAPMGLSAITAYRGDIVQAQAAEAMRVPMIMSGSSLIRLEEVAEACPSIWFQAYLPGEQPKIDALLARVKTAKIETLVITVDVPRAGNRESDRRAGFGTPLKPSINLAWQGLSHPRWLVGVFLRTLLKHGMPHFENNYATRGAPIVARNVMRDFSDRGHLDWSYIQEIRRGWKGPMVLKGIMHPEDAAQAKAVGIDGIVVSNHGGRQLNGTMSSMDALPAVVDAVGDLPVLLDSGVRRGTDVVKALALGAKAVLVGRPFNYAAGVGGKAGVEHAISLISGELVRNMAMLGVTSIDQINAGCIGARR